MTDYTMCAQPGCWHFIEDNSAFGDYPGIAEFIHLDDGEKDYDHDAAPGITRSLDVWKVTNPSLFVEYADGKIGPNSVHLPRWGVPA